MKKEYVWKVRMHADKSGRGMFSSLIVIASSAKEARETAAYRDRGSDYPYASSARKLTEAEIQAAFPDAKSWSKGVY